MRMKLDINSSPLKLEVGEIYPYKIELHLTFALLVLLLVASYSLTALLAWAIAMCCFEISFISKFFSDKDSSSKKVERICINPFGLTSNLYLGNKKIMQCKIYSSLLIFCISTFIIIGKFGFADYLTFNINQSFFDSFAHSLLIISLVNLIPMANTTGYFACKKFFPQKNLKENILINYLPPILLIILAVELQNIILLISVLSIILYSSAQSFKNKAIEAGVSITVEDVYTEIEKIHKIKSNTSVRDSLNKLIRENSTISSIFKEDEFKGLVTKDSLLDNLSENLNENVESIAINVFEEIQLTEKLEKAFNLIDESDLKVVKVTYEEKLVGFLFRDVLYEFLLVNNMLEKLDKADDLFGDDLF